MSHQPERKGKNCLNCGTTVLGRYCHVCGQENVETKETFFSLLKHFVYDILHFDSKFFDTLRYLLFKPGFVPKQYVEGKRAHYLHPIRMYLFTSAIFFLVFFALRSSPSSFLAERSIADSVKHIDRQELIEAVRDEIKDRPGDTTLLKSLTRLQDTTRPVSTTDRIIAEGLPAENTSLFGLGDSNHQRVGQYDSFQKGLPAPQRDGWLKRKIMRRSIEVNTKYHGNGSEALKAYSELFTHKFSYLLFVSLPFFALVLKLLYARRKNFYYSDHAVFTLYHYIFSFILLLFVFLFQGISAWLHLGIFNTVVTLLVFAWPVYLFIAMHRFYGQGWGRTFSKFLLLNLLGIIVLLLLFAVFLFFTLFQL